MKQRNGERVIATRNGDDYVQIGVRVSKRLHREARLEAIRRGVSFMQFVAEALRDRLGEP